MGIISVYFSRRTSIWVYPTGLVNTIIYIYLSVKYHLLGEAAVNFYYTVMSVWGWWLWSRKNAAQQPALRVTYSSSKEWLQQWAFAAFCFLIIYAALSWARNAFAEGAIPWADGLASATAFTGMWLMARKKVESWWWWVATNFCSVPLYFVKGLVVTSVYYIILLVMAVGGLMTWQQKAKAQTV